ncbi:flagellar export chaperone FliS [Edaphobacter sp. 12200R-103]|uniref:flagellar export chaperone FliS n=1 Tax=Edaphobacter sp. 12200R-103 TaxID=2703788 RepID=UPI00138B2DC8|nr:flagellar export chaperone FliS [Edaphobacter sp. 12200R-103]QHS51333.1 flagellar export chaperone FliS [Edaphobacter sp. 12200R-103]
MEQNYQQQILMGATGVDLILALYDGLTRFLYHAIQCAEEKDVTGRRIAVSRALDILMYLQARLRPDLAGSTAQSLSDFYAAMFTLALEASHYESVEQFQEVIASVRNVRDAWLVAARDPDANRVLPRELRTKEELFATPLPPAIAAEESQASRWSA